MLPKVLCFFGRHRWCPWSDTWLSPFRLKVYGVVLIEKMILRQERGCLRCYEVESRWGDQTNGS